MHAPSMTSAKSNPTSMSVSTNNCLGSRSPISCLVTRLANVMLQSVSVHDCLRLPGRPLDNRTAEAWAAGHSACLTTSNSSEISNASLCSTRMALALFPIFAVVFPFALDPTIADPKLLLVTSKQRGVAFVALDILIGTVILSIVPCWIPPRRCSRLESPKEDRRNKQGCPKRRVRLRQLRLSSSLVSLAKTWFRKLDGPPLTPAKIWFCPNAGLV
jgi:hypothetical protein